MFGERQIGGVRTYTASSESAPIAAGRTVVLHDSMMNFAKGMIAPYFEEVHFIHWNDISLADYYELVSTADRVIIEVVERSSHIRATSFFDNDAVDRSMRAALEATP